MKRLFNVLSRSITLMGKIAGAAIILCILVITYDVMMRYFFNKPTSWGYEVSCYLLLVVLSLSIPYSLSVGAHIKVDMAYDRFPPKLRAYCDLLGFIMFLLFGGFLLQQAIDMLKDAYTKHWVMVGTLLIPAWWLDAIMTIGFAALILECLYQMYGTVWQLVNDSQSKNGDGRS